MGELSLQQIYENLKVLFPESIDISTRKVEQGGVYLLFTGLKPQDYRKDTCSFSILVASRSMVEDKNSILPTVDDIRERCGNKEALKLFPRDIFKGVSVSEFTDTLYIYEISLEISLDRDIDEMSHL